MQIIVLLFLFLVLCVIIFGAITLSAFMIGWFKGAPYVPSKREKIARMLALADIQNGERVFDLGSGNGIVLIEAARAGAMGTGIECNPFLVWLARRRIAAVGLSEKIKIIRGDFRDCTLADADVVFVYLMPKTLTALQEKLQRELKSGARIISNDFPIAGWTPIHEEDGIFVYRKM